MAMATSGSVAAPQSEFKGLNRLQKLRALCVAAASGSREQLERVVFLIKPCLFPGCSFKEHGLEDPDSIYNPAPHLDSGSAAVRAGHLTQLQLLMEHQLPINAGATLTAAAQHCSLEGLQWVCKLLGLGSERAWSEEVVCGMAKAAGQSANDPPGAAEAKLQWLLQHLESVSMPEPSRGYGGSDDASEGSEDASKWWGGDPEEKRFRLRLAAAMGAAECGSLPLLDWLCTNGLDIRSEYSVPRNASDCVWADSLLVDAALRGKQLDAAEWLAVEAGFLGQEEGQGQQWNGSDDRALFMGAAQGGSAEAVEWLLENGARTSLQQVFECAALAGQVHVMEFLLVAHENYDDVGGGIALDETMFWGAVRADSVDAARWLWQQGCNVGKSDQAYLTCKSLAMVRFLACEV